MAQITLNSSGVASNGTLALQSNGTTTAVTIDASQNVGVGVTPSAWSGAKGLQVERASVFGVTSLGGFASNTYLADSGANYRYIATGTAALYLQNAAGDHRWQIAASGTAGNAITFTQAMTLDSSGNLLVGTTTASGNGAFTNGKTTASLALVDGTYRAWTSAYTNTLANASTTDAWIGRDAAAAVIGNNVLAGHFYVYAIGASGANAFTAVYSVVTTGNATSQATLALVSSVTRGTSPVSTVQIAADGAAGAVKLTITTINNSGVVTGGVSRVVFVGQIG